MHRVGRYEIMRELGRGGFGRVYAAFDPTIGRYVAIKTLNEAGGPDLLLRFRKEAAAACRLCHRNIVTIYDFGEHEGAPFLVMELLDGEDLRRAIARHGGLSMPEKVRVLREMSDGLHHAHRRGIVHGDIKPSNIMLLADGRIKILDFGVAPVKQAALSRLTPPGNLIGAGRYMSPEQFRGDPPDALTDIFAYGILCYELLTGQHPFPAADGRGAIFGIVNREPPSLAEHSSAWPSGLESIVLRTLAKERSERYQTLEDVKLDLEPVLRALARPHPPALPAETQIRLSVDKLESRERDGEAHLAVELSAAKDLLDRGDFGEAILRFLALHAAFPDAVQVKNLLDYALGKLQEQPPEVVDAGMTSSIAVGADSAVDPAPDPSSLRYRDLSRKRAKMATAAFLLAIGAGAVRVTSGGHGANPIEPPALPTTTSQAAGPPQSQDRPGRDPARPARQVETRGSHVRSPELPLSPKPARQEGMSRPGKPMEQVASAGGVNGKAILPTEPAASAPMVLPPPPPIPEKIADAPSISLPRAAPAQPPRIPQRAANSSSDRESADRQEILDLLHTYEHAVNRGDLKQLQASWPAIPKTAMESFRKAFRETEVHYVISLKPSGFSRINANSVVVECERTAETILGKTPKSTQVTHLRVTCERSGGRWEIREVEDLR